MTRSNWYFVGATTLALAVALALSVLVGESSVQAVPQFPHIVVGNVTVVDGGSPVNKRVEGRIDNVDYTNSNQTGRDTRVDADSTFGVLNGLYVCGNTTDTPEKEGGDNGETIQWYVDRVLAVAMDPQGNVIDPVMFKSGATDRIDLFLTTLNGPKVDATFSNDACKIGDEPPTPTPRPRPPTGPGPSGPSGPPPPPPPIIAPTETPTPMPSPTGTPRPLAQLFDDLTGQQLVDELTDRLEDDADALDDLIDAAGTELASIEALGAAIGGLSAAAAETVGENLAGEADIGFVGTTLAFVFGESTETGAIVLASMADANSTNAGLALIPALAVDTANTVDAIIAAAGIDPGNVTDAMIAGPAQSIVSVAQLGLEGLPVEPWFPEDAPECEESEIFTFIEGEWQCVGSPAPVERILARFASGLPGARVNIADVLELPAGVPPLPAGRVVANLLTIEPQGFQNPDVQAAHATMFVEKSFLDANQIHQWSVQFSRFDEDASRWVPSSAKRIREDEEKVFFSVVIPGFSLWAISGSVDVPVSKFLVENLTITPPQATEGRPVAVTVRVTNLTDSADEFVASLFLNSVVHGTQSVPLGANGTATVTFRVQPIAGAYDVRVDRLIGTLQVTVPPTPTPTFTPRPTATATPPTPTPIVVAVPAPITPTAVPEPVITPAVIEPERGAGLVVGILVGALAAIGVAAVGAAIFLRGRPMPPPAPASAPPAPEDEPAEMASEAERQDAASRPFLRCTTLTLGCRRLQRSRDLPDLPCR